jgi:hypothetical protein
MWLPYSNDSENDCVPAAIAHVIQAQRGVPPTDAAVQGAFKSWCGSGGCNVGLTMWRFLISGLDGYRPWSFGMIARNQSEMQWAIDTYKGFIAGINDGHEVAVIRADATNVTYVSDGAEITIPWTQFLAQADRNCFAFSKGFDPHLIWSALTTNWVWWVWGVVAVIGGAFYAGLI